MPDTTKIVAQLRFLIDALVRTVGETKALHIIGQLLAEIGRKKADHHSIL